MAKLALFVCSVAVFLPFLDCHPDGLKYFRLRDDVIYTVDAAGKLSTCSELQAYQWTYDFHNCFVDRKYGDGGQDLNSIVDRILDHSKDCIDNSTKPCRPSYRGLLIVLDKVIEQVQDYSRLYLDDINHGREKIKDLKCVEDSLENKTYADCFKPVFKVYTTEENFQEKVEKALSCTNKANKLCSKAAKTSLNRLVRDILSVKQPKNEDIEDDIKPPPPKRWYDYIAAPFIYAWKKIKSWFGY